MGKDKDGKAGSVALFNHTDISRFDAYNVTAGLVDKGGEHGCVFIRRHD